MNHLLFLKLAYSLLVYPSYVSGEIEKNLSYQSPYSHPRGRVCKVGSSVLTMKSIYSNCQGEAAMLWDELTTCISESQHHTWLVLQTPEARHTQHYAALSQPPCVSVPFVLLV